MAESKDMKILVVDDMMAMRKIVKNILLKLGYEKLEFAADGVPAWEKYQQAQSEGEPFDFVISDWNMPDMSGIELLRKVRAADAAGKKTHFLMLTALTEKENVTEAIKAGVSHYISKPFDKEQLGRVIDKILNK